jgi:hypothetical protein
MSRLRVLLAASAAFLALFALASANAQSPDFYAAPAPAPCGAVAPYGGASFYGQSAYGGGFYGPGSCGARAYAAPPYYGPAGYYGAGAYGGAYGGACGCRQVEVVQQTNVVAPVAPVGCSPCAAGGGVAPYAPPYAPYGGAYGYGRGDAMAACAARFRSFDPGTGTYLSYSGVRMLCPYLGG